MNNKKIIAILIGISLIIAGVFSLTKKRTALAPVVENQTETVVINPNVSTENNPVVPPITPVSNTSGTVSTSKLTDKKWMWVRTENSDKTVTTPNKPDIFGITFTSDNHVALATDCNGMGGDYTTTGNTHAITINGLISTLMYCENSEESIFSGMIQNVASYSFPNTGGLELILKNNGGKMIFK